MKKSTIVFLVFSALALFVTFIICMGAVYLLPVQSTPNQTVTEHTIVKIHEVHGYTSWSGWTTYQDSSHTVSINIPLEVFPMSVVVDFVNNTKDYLDTDFNTYYPLFMPGEVDSYAVTMWRRTYPSLVFVVIPHEAKNDTDTKSHEISHAVDKIMLRLGIDDTEVRAYLVGYLMRQIEDVPEWKENKGGIVFSMSN